MPSVPRPLTTGPAAVKGLERIGGFALVEQIARGGMSTLYLASPDPKGGRVAPVVVKVLDEDLARRDVQAQRFCREARILTTLVHPNVVRGLDYGVDSGRPYTVMEYLPGVSLASVMRACDPANPPHHHLAGLVAAVARGLHALHEHRRSSGEPWNLVHRDMSPQNVVVSFEGEVRIIDFGLAEQADRTAPSQARPLRDLSGKIAYLAPEQIGAEEVDRRADIYALGVILWEASTLRRLFGGEHPAVTWGTLEERLPPPPSRYVRSMSRQLETIIVQALRRDPRRRQASAAEVAAELERYVGEAGDTGTGESASEWMTRRFFKEIEEERRRMELVVSLP